MSCFNYISPEAAERFFSDEAKNEKLGWFPPELLVSGRQAKRMRKMAFSRSATERAVAAGHPALPTDLIGMLALDSDRTVRSWAVRNICATEYTLILGTDDEDPGIAAYARYRLDNEFGPVVS